MAVYTNLFLYDINVLGLLSIRLVLVSLSVVKLKEDLYMFIYKSSATYI